MIRRGLFAFVAALSLTGFAPPAGDASAPNFVIRLYGRVLGFHLPAGFHPVTPHSSATQFLMEIVPQGETVESWTRLITIRSMRGISPAMPSADIATALFDPKSCTKGHLYRDSAEKPVEGRLRLSIIAIGCGGLPPGIYPAARSGAGEQDFILMFRDDDAIYTLNYAVRGSAFDGDHPPIDPARAEAVLRAQFGTARVCATAAENGCATIIAADTARRANQ